MIWLLPWKFSNKLGWVAKDLNGHYKFILYDTMRQHILYDLINDNDYTLDIDIRVSFSRAYSIIYKLNYKFLTEQQANIL